MSVTARGSDVISSFTEALFIPDKSRHKMSQLKYTECQG